METPNRIFREKSLERISSPEALNEYIRVLNPSLWYVLAAVMLLLIGVVVWGICGSMETKLFTVCQVEAGRATVYVKAESLDEVTDKPLFLDYDEYVMEASHRSVEPVLAGETLSDYALTLGKLSAADWVYAFTFDTDQVDGVYEAFVVTESVTPSVFVVN